LDRNRLRRATLVRGFGVSWAAVFPCCAASPCSSWSAAECPPCPLRRALSRALCRALRHALPGGPVHRRTVFSRLPADRTVFQSPPGGKDGVPVASRRGERLPESLLALTCGRATHLQPNGVPICHGHSPKYAPSVQQPHGDGRSRGPTEWKSDRGERTFTRGDTVGGDNRSSERVRRPRESVGRRIPGEPTTRSGAPFAP
jgi:hypothetical protein